MFWKTPQEKAQKFFSTRTEPKKENARHSSSSFSPTSSKTSIFHFASETKKNRHTSLNPKDLLPHSGTNPLFRSPKFAESDQSAKINQSPTAAASFETQGFSSSFSEGITEQHKTPRSPLEPTRNSDHGINQTFIPENSLEQPEMFALGSASKPAVASSEMPTLEHHFSDVKEQQTDTKADKLENGIFQKTSIENKTAKHINVEDSQLTMVPSFESITRFNVIQPLQESSIPDQPQDVDIVDSKTCPIVRQDTSRDQDTHQEPENEDLAFRNSYEPFPESPYGGSQADRVNLYDHNTTQSTTMDSDIYRTQSPALQSKDLSDSFSKINLVQNDEFAKPQKRVYTDILTPLKSSTRALASKHEHISSPMRAPPPFKKLMFELNSHQPNTVPELSSFGNMLSKNFSIEEPLNSELSLSPTNQSSKPENDAAQEPPVINSLTPQSNKNLMSIFDPYAPVPESFRISTPDLKQMNADQDLASLIPLPNSPDLRATTKEKKISETILEHNGNLLVPITPSRTQWNEANIDWESPTDLKVYKDSDIEKRSLDFENRQKELAQQIINMKNEENIRHNNKEAIKQKNEEIQKNLAKFEKEKKEYMEIARLATERLELELAEYKLKHEQSASLAKEMSEKNNFLSLKLDTVKSDFEQKSKSLEKRLAGEYSHKLEDQKKEYEEKMQKMQKSSDKKFLDMELEYKDFEQQLKDFEEGSSKEVSSLKQALEKERQELEKIQSEYQEYIKLSGNYMDMRDKESEGLTKVVANLTLENHHFNESVAEMSKKLQKEEENSKLLLSNLNDLEAKNKAIIADKLTLEKDLNIAVERENLIVKHFKEQIDKDKERLNSLSESCSKLEQENGFLKTQLARLEFSLKKSNKEISNLKEENVDLNRMYSDLEQMVSNRR